MKKHTRKDAVELDIVVDLAEVSPDTTVADLQDLAERNRLYKAHYKASALTVSGWCTAMCISESRHKAYWGLRVAVPNSILNKSKKVCNRIKRCIQTLNNMGL